MPTPTKCSKDWLEYGNAVELAHKVKDCWAERGHEIRTWVEAVSATRGRSEATDQKIYVVRSDLLNGMPCP